MASYPYHQYQFYDPHQVQFVGNVFGHGHSDVRRSKSPSSLRNHSGYSPGPLSTPPVSRNPSQAPDQAEQMICDDNAGSLTDSPTSVNTPDDDMLDVESLGEPTMGTLYDPQSIGITTQMLQQGIPAMDSTTFFNDMELEHELNVTLASQSTQYSQPYNSQNSQFHSTFGGQSLNRPCGYEFSTHPSSRDHSPWNSQRLMRNPNGLGSGTVVFDPVSDREDYTQYVNPEVNRWVGNNPDPNFLNSPNEPLPSLNENGFYNTPTQQNYQQRPTHMRLTVPDAPNTSLTFVNYDHFKTDFNDGIQLSPSSPDTSTMGSSTEQLPSPYQENVSFQTSIASPDGSEGMITSYQNSESGFQSVKYNVHSEAFDAKPALSISPVHFGQNSHAMAQEASPDTSPEPEAKPEQHSRAHSVLKGPGGRPGGRALGTHLDAKVAKAAHDMRKIVACWHCVLQRDKCGPGDTCERCLKRSNRPNADIGLGCSRIKLIELGQYFIPSLVTQMHEDAHLTHFVSKHIRQWGNVEITIYMTCGQSHMPRIPVKVYEFIPADDELLVQIQYKTDPATGKSIPVRKRSPALGMVHINHNEEKKYDKYIGDIVDNHMLAFAELCWMEDDNDFQQKLLKLMIKMQPKNDDEAKLRREVFRLLVATFIVSHVLNIAEEGKHSALSKMHSYDPSAYIQNFTTPRMTNRQLKYFFSRLQRSIMSNVLNKLQQIFKSSKGCDKWLAAFIAVVGMCMAHEDMQKTIHLVQDTKAVTEKLDRRDCQSRADFACREIDSRMGFINQIFRWKYNRKCNPLRDADLDWNREVGFGDEHSVDFVRKVSQLVKENIDFLQLRQSVSISNANQTKYTSRLVGQFLLSFWLPQIS